MRPKLLFTWGFLTLASWFLLATHAHGAMYGYASTDQKQDTKYQRPEDLLDKVPFLSEVPRTFLFGDGFKMHLGTSELRIDHMGSHSRSPVAKRNCLFGLSYTTPVAGFFTSRVDLPLWASQDLHWSDWTRCSLGDYVAYFSRGAAESASLRFVLSAKF